jgi:c-di-GMP-binding flagellar brake protein YcgR
MDDNQRAFFRIDATVPAVVRRLDRDGKVWDEFKAETVDLSAGGVLLRSAEPAPAGHRLELELHCERPELELTSIAEVVRSWRAGKGVWLTAAHFERLAPKHERDLIKFCFLKEREIAERVSNVRIDVVIPTVLECAPGTAFRGSTVNVCSDGAYIAGPYEAQRDDDVTIALDERWFGREMVLRARVRRRDERGVDLEFCDLSRADRAAINQLVIAEERRRRAA